MSRYIDINQLLQEIGTSARSAGDPWTLGRSYRDTANHNAFSPSVVGDLGGSRQDLTSGIQSSEQITYADEIASSPTAGSGTDKSSTGGGILGGLLNFFPLASGIAKLFGFGGSSAPPALTPYQHPPSINFEGAMSGPTSGMTSLSYGENGLPRASEPPQSVNSVFNTPPTSNFTDTLSNIAGLSLGQKNATISADESGQLSPFANLTGDNLSPDAPSNTADVSPAGISLANGSTTNTNIVGQLMTLASSNFATEPSSAELDYAGQNSAFSPSSFLQSGEAFPSAGTGSPGDSGSSGAGVSSTSSQQGQSILVQVQAMDSQSFMDHSQEIAQAVRQAMLNMNSLNDVILDL